MVIDIENLSGSVREGTDPNGKHWRIKFDGVHYGELRDSLGADGDKLDIYIRAIPRKAANRAYIVHQNFPRTHPTKGGQYDEDKVILGVNSADEAKALYLKHYNRKDFFRSITEMPVEAFKRYAMGENKGEKVAAGTTPQGAEEIGRQIGVNWAQAKFPISQLKKGIDVEQHEHGSALGKGVDVGGDSDSVAARIAWSHLKEISDYYTRLAKMERLAEKEKKAVDLTEILKLAGCDTKGAKKRSGGKGQGLGRGDGEGPLGKPLGAKEQEALANVGIKESYDFGLRLAAAVASKNPPPYDKEKAVHGAGGEVSAKSLAEPKPALRLKKNLLAQR